MIVKLNLISPTFVNLRVQSPDPPDPPDPSGQSAKTSGTGFPKERKKKGMRKISFTKVRYYTGA